MSESIRRLTLATWFAQEQPEVPVFWPSGAFPT